MSERELQRKIKQRLATLRQAAEVTGNVAQTCRPAGIQWVTQRARRGLDSSIAELPYRLVERIWAHGDRSGPGFFVVAAIARDTC
jgi:hypothetical protein